MKKIVHRLVLAVLFITGIAVMSAYEVPEAIYPVLPKNAGAAELFTPAGWTIEVMEKGDLNKDKRDDLLLVLKENNPANMIANDPDSPGVHEWDANPRILAVAFALTNGGYELVLQSDDFLPRHENPCIDDPFGGAEILDAAIQIRLHFWANAGTWYTSDSSFTFSSIDKAFRLITYSNYTTKRNTGETWYLKLDNVSRKAEITIGNFSIDEIEDKKFKKTLPQAPLLTIEAIGPGMDFSPEQLDLSWWGIEGDSVIEG